MSKITPFDHQQSALDDIREFTLPLGQVIMPCGTGKTYVSAWTAADFERVVFLAPSVAILKQAGRSWGEVGEEPTVYVCGDGEVGRNVTTDVDVLAKAIRDRSSWRIFGTYASAAKIATVLREIGEADLIICDEAHHIAGREGKAWAHVLTEEFPGARRLFFTATQRTQRGKKRNALLVGMEDEEVFGPIVHELTYKDAIEQGLITDYRVELVEVPAGGNDTKTKQEAAVHAAVKKAHDEGRVRCSIVMRHEVKQARESAALLTEMGMYAVVISGEDSAKEREDLAAKAVAECGVICACRALGEGVDIPGVDGVVFMDPKTSVVDIIQSIGRGMRLDYPGKVATIVVPFVVERGVDVEVDGALGHVLRALRETDERMEAAIMLTRDAKVTGGGLADDTVDFLRVKGLLAALEGPAGEAVLREAFGDAFEAAFECGLAHLKAFAEREGHTRVPDGHREGDFPLHKWVDTARQRFTEGERAQKLEGVRGWVWSLSEERWANALAEVNAFVRVHGYLPRSNGTGAEKAELRLGGWATHVRRLRRAGKLTDGQAASVEAIPGWVWNPRGRLTEQGAKAKQAAAAVSGKKGIGPRMASERKTTAFLSRISDRWVSPQEVVWGVGPESARQALNRLCGRGLLECQRVPSVVGGPSRTRYRRTPAGTAYLAEHNEPTEQAAK